VIEQIVRAQLFRRHIRALTAELGHHAFDIKRLNLDIDELQRVGPLLVFDYRATSGERVLIWTQ